MSQDHEQQQERIRLKNQTKTHYQATRRANPVLRSLEQSSDIAQKRIAREEPGVREQRREQEQPANTRQRAVAREEPGVREQRQEQEQPPPLLTPPPLPTLRKRRRRRRKRCTRGGVH